MNNINTIDSKHILSVLADIESKIDVKSWKIKDINIWPFLRVSIRPILFNQLKSEKQDSLKSSSTTFKRRISKAILFIKEIKRIPFKHFLKTKDIFYMSDGVSLECVNGVWGDKYFRSIREDIKDLKLSYLFASPFNISKNPFEEEVCSFMWLAYLAEILASIRVHFPFKMQIEGYEQFIKILKSHGIPLENFAKKEIFCRAYIVWIYYRFFLWFFKNSKIRLYFILSYYHNMGFALNKVCQELNVKSVEIQHGTQSGIHDAYNQWLNIPKNGYPELPQIFWVWTSADVKFIDEWAKNTAKTHQARLTGNISYGFWDRNSKLLKSYNKQIMELKKDMNSNRDVLDILVSLQPVSGFRQYWNTLACIIQNESLNVRWWLRHHPLSVATSKFEGLDHILTISKKNVNFKEATDLPLCFLLKNVDLHITIRSSTAIEAGHFGVPTLFLSSIAINEHSQLDSSFKHIAEQPKDIVHFINTFDKQKYRKLKEKKEVNIRELIVEAIQEENL